MKNYLVVTLKFNPVTNQLFTDDGQLIKKLQCPYRIDWDSLEEDLGNAGNRKCSQCNHNIIDASNYPQEALVKMLGEAPNTCLKITLIDPNLQMIHGKHRRIIR